MPHRDHLLGLLAAHQPADGAEAEDVARMQRFVRAHADCFGKANPLGHVTASAIIIEPGGRTLMTFHAKLDRWLQVGGHTDPEEYDPLQTALREAFEESGLPDLEPVIDRPLDIDIHRIPARKREAAHDHLDVRYLFRTRRPAAIAISAESHELRWFPRSALDDLGLDAALRRAFDKVWALQPTSASGSAT